MPRQIPYAVANYEKIVRDQYHFVDKTRYIRELEKYSIPVFLRPRRFGKSLWCSILECYYDVNRRDRFDELFGNTDIGQNPTPLRNSHLVLRFDLSVVEVKSEIGHLESAFNRACRDAIRGFAAKNKAHADFTDAIQEESATDALRLIFSKITSNECPPVHLIIDEYDNFTNQLLTTRQDALYREVTTGDSFLRTFYKVIKAAVGDGTVDRVFITGVLPVTMDDLTSGFNIGQIVTLKENLLEMMGFTQAEVDQYLDEIFAEHDWPESVHARVREDLRTHYNGYRLLPNAKETIYNSTICNYYLTDLVIGDGKIPRETIDENLRVDVNWLRRLTGSDEKTRELLDQLMFKGGLTADLALLRSKFNMRQFFEPEFYPLSLYYLGMLTFVSRFKLGFPNLTTKTIFTEYFNEVQRIQVSLGYADMFERFLEDHDLSGLFAGYWDKYIGQVPAQAFDKANENFFRTTFYELCTRYLLPEFAFAIEVNYPSGRSDWQAVGRPNTDFEGQALLVEFKHYPREKADRLDVMNWTTADEADITQVSGYADDLKRQHPEVTVRRHIVYTIAGAGYRFFPLD